MNLKESLGFILFNVIMYRLDRSLKLKSNVINKRHIKRLCKLHNQKRKKNLIPGENPPTFIREIVLNFSSHHLTTKEENALSYSLDGHIPTCLNRN